MPARVWRPGSNAGIVGRVKAVSRVLGNSLGRCHLPGGHQELRVQLSQPDEGDLACSIPEAAEHAESVGSMFNQALDKRPADR